MARLTFEEAVKTLEEMGYQETTPGEMFGALDGLGIEFDEFPYVEGAKWYWTTKNSSLLIVQVTPDRRSETTETFHLYRKARRCKKVVDSLKGI